MENNNIIKAVAAEDVNKTTFSSSNYKKNMNKKGHGKRKEDMGADAKPTNTLRWRG